MGKARPGVLNNNWRGGRSIASNGYVLVRVGVGHSLADVRGYAYEHRVEAEKKIGRPLLPSEHVHHIDENKQNNNPENLRVVTIPEHRLEHRKRDVGLRLPGEENPTVRCACGCSQTLARFDATGRPREFISGHNPQRSPTLDAILSALSNGALAREEIIARTGISKHAVATALSRLKRRGDVESVGHGYWKRSQ